MKHMRGGLSMSWGQGSLRSYQEALTMDLFMYGVSSGFAVGLFAGAVIIPWIVRRFPTEHAHEVHSRGRALTETKEDTK